MMLRAIGYCRVSTTDQAESGHSLDAQTRAIREFCDRKGWELVEIYTDAGISGSLDKRPALQKLLASAEAGRCEVVVVHAIDRFYRSLSGLLRAIENLRQHNVSFVSLTENLDFTTPWGKLTLAVLGTLAEIYLDKLKMETTKGLLERAKKGLHNGSVPLGYCRGLCTICKEPNGKDCCPNFGKANLGDGKTLISHPIESVTVKLAFEWARDGKLSNGQIAEKLNAYQYTLPDGSTRPLRSKGVLNRIPPGPFGKDTVRDILKRIFYTGVVPYYGVNDKGQKRKRLDTVALYPGKHPALIEQSLFDRVQENRKLLSRNPRKRHNSPARIYPLSGIFYCGQCGAKMRARHADAYNREYYSCTTRLQKTGVCSQKSVLASRVEAQVYELLCAFSFSDGWQDALVRHLGRDPLELAKQEADIKKRLARASELYLTGLLNKAKFFTEKRLAENALADLQITQLSAIIEAKNQLDELRANWDSLENLNKKRLLQRLITKVFIRSDALSATKLSEHLFTLKTISREGHCFYNGSDGIRNQTHTLQLIPPTLPLRPPRLSPINLAVELGLFNPADI